MADERGPRRDIRFPPYRLDLVAERLLRDDDPLPLRPKTFAVLRFLAERPDVLVTKDALLQAVWPGIAVTESTLTKSIGEIRAMLGDDPRQPSFLATVHGRGFRFLGRTLAAADDRATPTWPLAPGLVIHREAELARLHAALEDARAGCRQTLFVTGEAGIGKTTVLSAFLAGLADRAGAGEIWLATGQCVQQRGSHEPYMPMLTALDRLARGPRGDIVVEILRRHALSWIVQLPWLMAPEESQRRRAELVGTTAARMLRMFLHLTDELARRAPLVIALEDLHWADASTVDLIAALGRRDGRAAILLIGTYRPAEALVSGGMLETLRGELACRRQSVVMALDPLSPAGVKAYLTARFPGRDVPFPLVRLLHSHTDGNPLFLVTAIERLCALGYLRETANGLEVAGELAVIERAIPASLRELVEALAAAADPFDVELLEAASAVGTEFGAQAVAAALDVDTARVEAACERLVRAQRFLHGPVGVDEWPDGSVGARYRFVHGAYRRIFYDRLPPARARTLHRRIGLRLESSYGTRVVEAGAEIGAHFEHAGDHERAARHLINAAAAAAQRFAPREAAACLRRALGLLGSEPADAIGRRRELTLRCQLVAALVALDGYSTEDVRQNIMRASELAADTSDAAQVFRLRYAMFLGRVGAGDAAMAQLVADELEREASRLEVAAARHIAHFAASYVALFRGHGRDADGLTIVRRLSPETLDGFFYGSNPVVVAGAADGLRCWILGRPDEAAAVIAEAVACARGFAFRLNLAMASALAALVHVWRGDLDLAAALVDEGLQITDEFGFGMWRALHVGLSGMVSARRGDGDRAASAIAQAVDDLRAHRNELCIPLLLAELAEVARRRGRVAEGLAHVAEGLAQVEKDLAGPISSAELWRQKGELLIAAGRPWREPWDCFRRALEVAHDQGSRAFELRAATSFARLCSRRDAAAEGIATLQPILEGFSEGLGTFDVREAVATLRALAN